MGQVLAHETDHIFYGLDEYSRGNSYTDASGYYGTKVTNTFDDHPDPNTRTASIMAEASLQSTAYTDHTSTARALCVNNLHSVGMQAWENLACSVAGLWRKITQTALARWKYSGGRVDANGIFDVLDVPLTLTGTGGYDTALGQYQFNGHSMVGTLGNLNTHGTRHDITTNNR